MVLSRKSKSVLFFNPDYHCSFFLRDELRRRGWHADVFVPSWYPQQLLFSDDAIFERTDYGIGSGFLHLIRMAQGLLERTRLMVRYRYVIHYGSLNMGTPPTGIRLQMFLMNRTIWYRFMQLTGVQFIYLPSGCLDHVSKKDWTKVDDGRVCSNCGYEPNCDDRINNANFELVRRIAAASLAGDGHQTDEFRETRIRYKSFDLDVFAPDISVPLQFQWASTSGLSVLHSHALTTRNLNKKNIKGTPHIIAAIEQLQREGFDLAFMNMQGVESRYMRFHQAQADIIVDQLIYGGYGSTALEGLALGKPVICYIRPSWKEYLSSIYPEWNDCPIISATPETIYAELRKLVSDAEYRIRVGKESRRFAERFLDVRKNVIEFESVLLKLK